jgi:hypothetical protein
MPNPPVNADARGRAAICVRSVARAGYRARYVALANARRLGQN